MAGLSARGIDVALGGRRVLDGIDLDVGPGEVVAVRAPSGAGKSTLLRALVRLVPLAAGSVSLDGVDALRIEAPILRRRVGLVSQTPVMLEGTVADNCRYAHDAATDADVADALEAAGLDAGFATRIASELSGGERARVALARALVRGPEHLLLDEPTAALDLDVAQRIGQLVVELADRGLGICLTTHDGGFADRYAQRQVSL